MGLMKTVDWTERIQNYTDKDKNEDETVCVKLVSLRPGWDRIPNVVDTRKVAYLRILHD